MNRGFTLVEVCVATAVFSLGVLSLDAAFKGINSKRRLERAQVHKFLCEEAAMESLVFAPPSCDAFVVEVSPSVELGACSPAEIRLQPVYGGSKISLAEVRGHSDEKASFRRLLRCK